MSRESNDYFKMQLRRFSLGGLSFFPQSPECEFVDRLLMGPEFGKKEGKSDGDEETRNPEPCEADAFRHWNRIIAEEWKTEGEDPSDGQPPFHGMGGNPWHADPK